MRLSDYGSMIYGAECLDSIFSFRKCYCEHLLSFSPGEGGSHSTYPALLNICIQQVSYLHSNIAQTTQNSLYREIQTVFNTPGLT